MSENALTLKQNGQWLLLKTTTWLVSISCCMRDLSSFFPVSFSMGGIVRRFRPSQACAWQAYSKMRKNSKSKTRTLRAVQCRKCIFVLSPKKGYVNVVGEVRDLTSAPIQLLSDASLPLPRQTSYYSFPRYFKGGWFASTLSPHYPLPIVVTRRAPPSPSTLYVKTCDPTKRHGVACSCNKRSIVATSRQQSH